MIALAVSLVFALYVVGPDAVSRFLLGFTIPRRNLLLTKSEEISRALVWAASSFVLALLWARWTGALTRVWRPASLRVFFSGIYSEAYFHEQQAAWFASLRDVFWINWTLLWRLYAIVVLLSILLTLATQYYGLWRSRLPAKWMRDVFAAVVLPRVAQWHVLLSKVLLADRSVLIYLDILTKSDKLYQGTFFDKALAADGTLISITLTAPKRFDRAAYLKAQAADTRPDPARFWKPIPTNMFVVMASDINTINLRYAPENRDVGTLKSSSPELTRLLESIADQVNAIRSRESGASGEPES